MIACIEAPSPNRNNRPEGAPIDTVLIHYTGMETGPAALARLCDPAAVVSAHYLIEEDGRLFRLVPEAARAWHAGVSAWRGRDNLNHTSIGIELVHPGHEHGYRAFADRQIDALIRLLHDISARHTLDPWRIIGHADCAPGRKADPGELFPWIKLAEAGFGRVVPAGVETRDTASVLTPGTVDEQVAALQARFVSLGYGLAETGLYDAALEGVVMAFQQHWRQSHISGVYDVGTEKALTALLELNAVDRAVG